jgi:hypothetical protein
MIFKSINPDENPSDDEGSLTGDDPMVKILDICHDPMDDLEDHDLGHLQDGDPSSEGLIGLLSSCIYGIL